MLACYHHSPDAAAAAALPFLYYWGAALWFWCLLGIVGSVGAWMRGTSLGLSPVRWLVLFAFLFVFTGGSSTIPAFLLLPFWSWRVGWRLGRREAGVDVGLHRAFVVILVLLTPLAYGRLVVDFGHVPGQGVVDVLARGGIGLAALLGLLGLGFSAGADAERAEASEEWSQWVRTKRPKYDRSWPLSVRIQSTQCCPLCWDELLDDEDDATFSDARTGFSICPSCRTVLHTECARGVGCSSLGCEGRAPRRIPPLSIRITERESLHVG